MGKRIDPSELESGLDIISGDDSELDDDKQKELDELFEPEDDDQSEDREESEDDDEPEDKDDDVAPFDGFGEDDKQEETQGRPIDPILEEARGMTPEQYQELVKTNPMKAMQISVASVLDDFGVLDFDPNQLMEQTQTYASVNETRKVIAQRFEPHKNKALREKAMDIYKSRGFDVKKHPRAELDAFLLAVQENPELMEEGEQVRNEPVNQHRRRRRPEVNTVKLTKEDREIAEGMGVDLSDPKQVRRIAKLKADYARRRR